MDLSQKAEDPVEINLESKNNLTMNFVPPKLFLAPASHFSFALVPFLHHRECARIPPNDSRRVSSVSGY